MASKAGPEGITKRERRCILQAAEPPVKYNDTILS
jgi:hypothetical protein